MKNRHNWESSVLTCGAHTHVHVYTRRYLTTSHSEQDIKVALEATDAAFATIAASGSD